MAAALGQPIKWHGGKNYLARDIVALMPPHLNYVEPFAGGLAVLFARDPDDERLWLPPHKGVSEVVNDLNGALTNFWRVLQSDELFARFKRLADAVPFSGVEYNGAVAASDSVEANELVKDFPVECAVNFFIRNRQSLAGRMDSFTGITKTRTRSKMNNEVSAWLNCVDGLPQVHARLRRVLVLPPMDALAVIKKFDMPETLFYLDPPYLSETRASPDVYAHEMGVEAHHALCAAIRECKGKVMLSGYPSALYHAQLETHDWKRHDFKLPNQAAGGKKKRVMTECLWTNF